MRRFSLILAAVAISASPFVSAMSASPDRAPEQLAKSDKADKHDREERQERDRDHKSDRDTNGGLSNGTINDLATVITGAVFGQSEADIIRSTLGGQRASDLGMASLPPGIAKNVARGKPLPPGIAKKLPSDVLRRLPMRDSRYERRVVGTDVVLIDAATQVVVDVLKDVLK